MAELFERYKFVILVVLGVILISVTVAVAVRYERPAPVQIIPPAPTPTPAPIRVYVSGAVAEPAVYEFPPGTIVLDALTVAGGPTDDALLDGINLAHILSDGEQLNIPQQGEPTPPPVQTGAGGQDASDDPPPAQAGGVNLNSATLAELETLPGIGPALAQRIIDYRETNGPFQRIEDIQNVAGIGPATFEDIRDLITVN